MRTIRNPSVALSHCRRIARPRHDRGRPLATLLAFALEAAEWVSGIPWPEPKVVDPGPVGGPPSDAIVLFDGKDMSQWNGGEKWIVKDGYAIAGGDDMIYTKQSFGDCQLHVEWAAPEKVEGHGQERGNSGVFMMGLYEIQVLDSYDNPTYFDGQAAAHLQATPAAGERLPQAGPVADVRHRLRGAAVRQAGQAGPAGVRHGFAQRRAGAESHPDPGSHVVGPGAEVHGPSVEVAAGAAVPRQSGPLPQHLDSRVCRRPMPRRRQKRSER